jgi:phage FluMu protein Com
MRLLTRQLHRAFPELDPFDDERCDRFVAQAARSRTGRLVSILAVLAAAAVGLVGPPAAISWLRSSPWSVSLAITPIWIDAAFVAGFVLGPFAAIIARDVALRLRIRRVIRARGRCYGCGYSLLGIPIGANLEVVCPECRTVGTVDAAMAALTDDATAFLPPTAAQWRSTAPTGERRSLRRIATRLAIAIATVLLIGGATYEGFLRWQAARAASLLTTTRAELAAWITSLGPKEGIDGWQELIRLGRQREALDVTLAESAPVGADDRPVIPGFDLIVSYPAGEPIFRGAQNITDRRDEAFRRLRAYEAAKLFDGYDALGAASLLAMPPPEIADSPAAWQARDDAEENLDSHLLLLAARMQRCVIDGDMAAMANTLRTMLALGRMSRMQASTIDQLKGARMDILAIRGVRRVLASNPSAVDVATIDALMNAIDSTEFTPPADYPWHGYRLAGRASVAWFFSNPSWVRFDILGAGARDLMGGSPSARQWIGTLSGTLDELEDRRTEMEMWATTPRWGRIGGDPSLLLPKHAAVAAFGLRGVVAYETMGLAELDRRGLRVQLEIERAIRTRGEPPESLDALLAERGVTMPSDPCAAGGLRYRRLTPEQATARPAWRGYMLYSVGPDGKDDGGRVFPSPSGKSNAWLNWATGYDYVLNDPD